jgi:hypothetical protein
MMPQLHKKKADKVAIVGFATETRHLAPFDQDTFEIWGVNNIYSYVSRVDVLFEMHDKNEALTIKRHTDHYNWMKVEAAKQKIPIYMLKHFEEIPTSIAYPISEIRAEFGDFFTNSIAYTIALAIYMKYKEIHIYGVGSGDFSFGEYLDQREGISYYIGLARGRGIFVFLPDLADLCKAPFLYGYENTDMWRRTILTQRRNAEMMKNSNQAEARKFEAYTNQFIGEMRGYDYMLNMVNRTSVQGGRNENAQEEK